MKLKEFSQRLDSSNRAIDIAERFGVSQLVRLSTYLGPAVPAYFVFEASKVHLTHEWALAAFLIAVVLELLGLGVIYNLNNLFEWNRKYINEQVSTDGAKWLVFFYAAQIVVIVFGLKIYPDAFLWLAIFGLSSLSILTGFAYSQGQQHKARMETKADQEELAEQENEAKRHLDAELREQRLRMELDIERLRAQNQLEIERRKAEAELQAKLMKVESRLSNGASKPASKMDSQASDGDERTPIEHENGRSEMDTLLDIYKQNPKASLRSVGRQIGRSPQTISNWLDELETKGIVHRNGQVEVL